MEWQKNGRTKRNSPQIRMCPQLRYLFLFVWRSVSFWRLSDPPITNVRLSDFGHHNFPAMDATVLSLLEQFGRRQHAGHLERA